MAFGIGRRDTRSMAIQSQNGDALQPTVSADTREMYMIHTVFRRECGLMPGLVRDARDGDHERIQIVTDHICFITSLLSHHHHAEDKHLWPRLLARGSEEIAPIVHVMERQHENIDRATKEVEDVVLRWHSGEASKQSLVDALIQIVPILDEHMTTEETQILPFAEKYITRDEWGAMVEDAISGVPQEDQTLIFGMAMYEGDPEVVRAALSNLPAEAQPIVKELAPKAFASYSERLYGTPTPPRVTGIQRDSAS